MFDIGVPEFIVIILAFALLFFGSSKISSFARSLGGLSGQFKKGKRDVERELREGEAEAQKDTNPQP